jgi:hypothetical protein
VITANETSSLAAFLRAHIGQFITSGSAAFAVLAATNATVWDDHKGRNNAANNSNSKLNGVKKDIHRIKNKWTYSI